jgi:hypothetical protein
MGRLLGDLGTLRASGDVFSVLAWGARREGATVWEGWLTFFASDGTALRTGRETVQPSVNALVYWAGGLRPVYLEGALARARPVAPPEAGRDYARDEIVEPPVVVDVVPADEDTEIEPDVDRQEQSRETEPVAEMVQVLGVDPDSGACTVRAGDRTLVLEPSEIMPLGVEAGDRVWIRWPRPA